MDFLDIRILSLPEEQLFHSFHSIADARGISYSTILAHVPQSLGMNLSHFDWILHQLTNSLPSVGMETFPELLVTLEAHEKSTFRRFVTADESWLILEFRRSLKWSLPRGEASKTSSNELRRKSSY
jgi:hypothetical protein